MYKFITLVSLFIISGCVLQNPSFYNASSEQFSEKFIDYIGPNEEIVANWYHYVITKDTSGRYIQRIFFPETKQITSEVRYKSPSLKIANGPARYWHENGNLQSHGDYYNNHAFGEWKRYHRKTGELSSVGKLKANLKVNSWKQYDSKGRIASETTYKNDHKEGPFIVYDTLNNIINQGIYQEDTIFKQTKIDTTNYIIKEELEEQMPFLSQCKTLEYKDEINMCSQRALLKYIYKSLKYPPNARNYGIQGTTVTQFTIAKNGDVKDLEVIIGICQEFKDECERVLFNMPKWEPGIQDGKNVDVLYTLPIKFKLE